MEYSLYNVYRLPRLSRAQLLDLIESREGYTIGFELSSSNDRGEWVWVRPVPNPGYPARGPKVSHCTSVRRCSEEEIESFIKYLWVGDVVLRVVYVSKGNNAFAVLRLD